MVERLGPVPVDRDLGHREGIRQIQGERLQRRQGGRCDGGGAGQPVDVHLVLEVEFVAGHSVAEVAVGRNVGVDDGRCSLDGPFVRSRHAAETPAFLDGLSGRSLRFLRNAFHGAIGLPCQRLDAGTSSPRMTNDAGPTVAPAPIRAAGNATQCGPSVAPSSSTTVSSRMIRSWNRWVCTTQPRLTVAPLPRVTRSASGSQYVSHHTPRPIDAPSARSHRFITGVPLAALANHGAATVSTNVSDTSLRHTNDDHRGCSTARMRPTHSHFATTAMPPATAPVTSSTTPPANAVHR